MTSATAMPAAPSEKSLRDQTSDYVSFWLDEQLFGVPVQTVQEVLSHQEIAATPLARPEIAGLLNLRGQIVTAVDLRRRMGLPPRSESSREINVVVRHRGESFSLQVDEVGDVITVPGSLLEDAPRTLDSRWRHFIAGIHRLDQRLLIVLDIHSLLEMA